MALVFSELFANIDGVDYFKITTVARIIGKSPQTIRLWDESSNTLEERGEERLIPKCTRVGKNNTRCWNIEEIECILNFSNNIRYGQIAEFSRTQWGERANTLVKDSSLKTRLEVKAKRKEQDKEIKKKQTKKKIEEIKKSKNRMLKAVQVKAKKIYDSIDY